MDRDRADARDEDIGRAHFDHPSLQAEMADQSPAAVEHQPVVGPRTPP